MKRWRCPPISPRASRATRRSILQEETGITRIVDPWAGSYYVERLTHELMHAAWALIEEVEGLGGMAKAIETGVPKMRIEEAAARRQARIDSGSDVIVGVNAYPSPEETADSRPRYRQCRGARIAAEAAGPVEARTRQRCRARNRWNSLSNAPATGEGNLLECAVDAARKRATLGEISSALEKVWGRYQATTRTIAGVYSAESGKCGGVQESAADGRGV